MSHSSFEPPVVVKLYTVYKTFLPLVIRFPKPYRYTLGHTIDETLLQTLRYIFEANALPRPLREAPLLKAQAQCDLVRLLVRLCFERSLIESTQYFQLIADLQEVAKMLGGWIGYIRNSPSNPPPPTEGFATTAGRAPSFGLEFVESFQFTLTWRFLGFQFAFTTPDGTRPVLDPSKSRRTTRRQPLAAVLTRTLLHQFIRFNPSSTFTARIRCSCAGPTLRAGESIPPWYGE